MTYKERLRIINLCDLFLLECKTSDKQDEVTVSELALQRKTDNAKDTQTKVERSK